MRISPSVRPAVQVVPRASVAAVASPVRSAQAASAKTTSKTATSLATQTAWKADRYTLTQKFMFPPNLDPKALLAKLDDSMRAYTAAAGVGTLHWNGGDLKMGPMTVVSLSNAHLTQGNGTTTLSRDILGGMLAGKPGGQLLFRCRSTPQGTLVEASLSGFQPRLPRALYLKSQEPAHRAVVGEAVNAVLKSITA